MYFERTPKTVQADQRRDQLKKVLKKHPRIKTEITPLTDEIIFNLCDTISKGAHVDIACASLGINKRTFSKWLKTGTDDLDSYLDMEDCGQDMSEVEISMHAELVLKFRKAVAELEVDLVQGIRDSGAWQGSSFILERMFPDRWAKKTDPGLAAGGLNKNIKYVIMTPDENPSIEDWSNQKKTLTSERKSVIVDAEFTKTNKE